MKDAILFNSRTPDWEWLSNFSPHPVGEWLTAEHAYQASKFFPGDPRRDLIKQAATPAEAKKIGKAAPTFPHWGRRKVWVMARALRIKFQDPHLKTYLLATGNRELIHSAPWGDTFWGVDAYGIGMNMQGQLLMALRDSLRDEHVG